MIKKFVTLFLISFVAVAVTVKIVSNNVPQESVAIPDGNVVVFCHAQVRCPTCLTMESLIKEVLAKQKFIDAGINLVMLEYDSPANNDFVGQFHIGTAAIVLLEQKDGQTVRSNNITSDAWKYVDYKKSFTEMLETNLNEFYQ